MPYSLQPYSAQQLTDFIRERALALGFAKVGFVQAEWFDSSVAAHLQSWLAQGFHADMDWMVTHLEKRLNPASLQEGTCSIVCVALNYYTPDDYDRTDPEVLKIAKYARGTDYHTVVKDRLKALLADVQALSPHIQGRALTDSAPILEKPLAQRAGLGWMGKNGNVILPGLGSWYFLGELLLNVPLVYDVTPIENHCGSCTRCLTACPTGAIVSEGVIDANRCISYWTIEHKGEAFPAEIQQKLNGWVFGCDICQDVCPWNVKFARPTQVEAFQPRPWNRQPQAAEILTLDVETFRERYRKSPIKRAKLAGFQRNVRLAQRVASVFPLVESTSSGAG